MAIRLSRRNGSAGNLSFKKIGLLAKAESPLSLACLKQLLPIFKKFQAKNPEAKIWIDKDLQPLLPKTTSFLFASAESMAKSCELLLSVGGDGTLLRAARLLLESEGWKTASLLGINTGRLGFLTVLGAEDAPNKIEQILSAPRKSTIEVRECLEIKILRKKKVFKTFHVLNDCVLKNGALARLIEFGVSMNGEFLSAYRADGLIVSTPTGSTAYNLAAGGAILDPHISAIQLTPICAQSFSNKPIVVSDKSKISLSLGGHPPEVYLTLDGHMGVKIERGDTVEIQKSPKSIKLLLPKGAGPVHYIHSLRQKLKWGLVSPPLATHDRIF
ncbi:MAG: ppnK [Bacteriovoracaceae bacterium]|nr:ppnK [Bacteriovoracaceae bacterium]